MPRLRIPHNVGTQRCPFPELHPHLIVENRRLGLPHTTPGGTGTVEERASSTRAHQELLGLKAMGRISGGESGGLLRYNVEQLLVLERRVAFPKSAPRRCARSASAVDIAVAPCPRGSLSPRKWKAGRTPAWSRPTRWSARNAPVGRTGASMQGMRT